MTDPASSSQTKLDGEFQTVYREQISWMLHTLRRLGVPSAELEDVAHDVFVAVYRQLAQYDSARPLRPWLFSFAYRMAKDHRALARHRHETSAPLDRALDPGASPDEQLETERLRALLLRVLAELDFDKRSIVVMHDVEGMAVPAIAELLGVPLNTAYSRLRLARAEFERHLERLGGRP